MTFQISSTQVFPKFLKLKPTHEDYNIKRVATQCNCSLRDMLGENDLILPSYVPGQYRLHCPRCKGGRSREKSLALKLDGESAVWTCHRSTCGWTGNAKEDFSHESQSYYDSRDSYRFLKFRAAGADSSPNGQVTPGIPNTGRKIIPRPRPTPIRPQGRDPTAGEGPRKTEPSKSSSPQFEPLDGEWKEFFSKRGISEATCVRHGVCLGWSFSPHEGRFVQSLAFPYLRDGEIVNCKYRTQGKQFWQMKGAEKVLYGLDDIKGQSVIYIVEGEMDKLALDEAGIRNCVSVPDGAPSKVKLDSVIDPSKDRKYEYLWNCREYLDKASKIVLLTDSDEPGQALAEELSRRLGKERCWRIKWPLNREGKVFKDPNEILQENGPSFLRECISRAEPFPIRGLFRFRDYFDAIDAYYLKADEEESGASTGWRNVDPFYRVVTGELTVVTGVPNSGKSEWIDALLCNLCQQHDWSIALCSMENKVEDHARKLMEKYTGQPFFSSYANNVPRMSPGQLSEAKEWVNSHFHVIRCEDDELPSIDWVLSLAKAAVFRSGIRGLVIDPYNELDHQRGSNQTETEYVSQMLTKVKRFAQHHDCHVWFVAHPKQLQQWKGEAPGLYDISGSAHFVNKCDNGIVVHRNRDPEQGPLDVVQILVRKVRNKAAGTIGETILRYDRVNGRYHDCDRYQ